MRLLDTSTGEFKTFEGNVPQKYSILSHRWDAENEVSYQDYKPNMESNSSGYMKIKKLCEIAKHEGSDYAWIDTCCIDKTSSAELTESINSMFTWYKDSSICYAYLSDVETESEFGKSQWWKRGWTLQELIAPAEVVFLDKHWKIIGTKADMAKSIAKRTSIPEDVLNGNTLYNKYTVAQRMSWASGRRTTRVEDEAYSLLGLFQIHMPPIYGEGKKAFQRLQLQIIQKIPDLSIFAWKPRTKWPHQVLATNARDFCDCGKLEPESVSDGSNRSEQERYEHPRFNPPRVTSWGIELHANAQKIRPYQVKRIYGQQKSFLWSVQLTIAINGDFEELPCSILLAQMGASPYSYCRAECLLMPYDAVESYLSEKYTVYEEEPDKTFFLHFDDDILF